MYLASSALKVHSVLDPWHKAFFQEQINYRTAIDSGTLHFNILRRMGRIVGQTLNQVLRVLVGEKLPRLSSMRSYIYTVGFFWGVGSVSVL